jgi:hypothetical protein
VPIIVHPSDDVSARRIPQFGSPIESVCSAAPSNNNVTLSLVVANDGVWKGRLDLHQSSARSLRGRISLRQVLQQQLLTRKPTIAHVLAVVLANSALQLSGTPWLTPTWGIDDIYFLETQDNGIILRPTIFARFSSEEEGIVEGTQSQHQPASNLDGDCYHPNRHILALGIVLLELFFKTPIEKYRMETDLTPEGKVDANTDYWAAYRAWNDEDWDVHRRYKEAVRCCLDWTENKGSDFNSLDLHDLLYNEIVRELEDELEDYNLTVSRLDKFLRPYKLASSSQRADPIHPTIDHILTESAQASRLDNPPGHHSHQQIQQLSGSNQAVSTSQGQENHGDQTAFSFFDDKIPRPGA